MQAVNLTCRTDCTELHFGGALDVGHTRSAYETLGEALTRALPLELHAGGLERVDTAALQLFLALIRSARARGLRCEWRNCSSALEGAAATLGLVDALELPK